MRLLKVILIEDVSVLAPVLAIAYLLDWWLS